MSIRLRHLAAVNPTTPEFDKLPADAEVPFLPLECIWPRNLLDTSRRKTRAELSVGYTRFRQGDILLPKITPTFQADRTVIASDIEGGVGAGTTELHVVRVGPEADSRYIRYLLSSKPFLELGEASMVGVAGQKRVPDDHLRNWCVPITLITHQRAIADYLDRETMRIDTLIAAQRGLVALLAERRRCTFEALLSQWGFAWPTVLGPDWPRVELPTGWRVIRLSQTLRHLTNGYVGPTRDILRDEGVRYIQSLHIKDGRIDFERGSFFVDEEWHRARPRIHLRADDVLIVQTGDIGQVAVVPPGFGEASCHALQIARVRPEVLSGRYLAAFLGSTFGQQSLISRGTGALHPHLEGGIRDVPIVIPPLPVQEEVVVAVAAQHDQLDLAANDVEKRILLLLELRQSLITAAVTGELDVPEAAA